MRLQLEGKRVLVTGSSSGVGAGVARFLADEGCVLAVHGRDAERAELVAEEIRAAGHPAIVALGDLADDEGAARVAATVDASLGGIDVLVNNAGGSGRGPTDTGPLASGFFELPVAAWDDRYQQNVLSALRMIHAFTPGMRERGRGRVVQISSTVSTVPHGYLNDYSAAKAGMLNLTAGLARAVAGSGVTSNSLSLGRILTSDDSAASFLRLYAREHGRDDGLPVEELDRLWARERGVPSGHAGRVEHVASMIALLASPLGAFVNGANIRIDGGMHSSIT